MKHGFILGLKRVYWGARIRDFPYVLLLVFCTYEVILVRIPREAAKGCNLEAIIGIDVPLNGLQVHGMSSALISEHVGFKGLQALARVLPSCTRVSRPYLTVGYFHLAAYSRNR